MQDNQEQGERGGTISDAEIKRILEALLLVSDKPLQAERAREAIGSLEDGNPLEPAFVRRLFTELAQEYAQANRGIRIIEVAEGFQLVTDPTLYPFISRLIGRVRTIRLSRPSLETLAIIAYRQPVTRTEMEQVRGVDSTGVLETLLSLKLIRVVGRKETVGRPLLYGTTREFLEHFGLKSLEDLPKLGELKGAFTPQIGPTPQIEPSPTGVVTEDDAQAASKANRSD